MKNFLYVAAMIILFILILSGTFFIGVHHHKKAVIKRALEQKVKSCYSLQDIETVIFGEIQE